MQVAAIHFTPVLGACDANRTALVEQATRAAQEAQVVVLPELATTGFCLTREQAEAWAEPADGPTAAALADVARAHQAVIVVGVALREDEQLCNAQLVFDADGSLVRVYRKHHLFGADHDWATPGAEAGAVADTAVGALGLLICHDIEYPHTVLAVASARPRLLAFSTAWIGDGRTLPASWNFTVRLLDPAPLVVANRGGREGEVRFSEPSLVLSHSRGGRVGPRTDGPYVVYGDLG